MRFIALTLIALVAITTVSAQNNADMLVCILKIKQPCQGDTACSVALSTYNTCITTKGCNKMTSGSEMADCMRPCIPDNALIKTYANQQIDCVNATVLSFAGLLLAIFAFVF